MKNSITMLLFVSISFLVNAQRVAIGVGSPTPDASSVLDLQATDKGFLVPRIANPLSISSPATGLMVYNTTTNKFNYYNGTAWIEVGSGSGNLTSVTGTAPIASSGGNTPAISISPATTIAAGSMSAADKTKLDATSGTNTGDQTITLTGNVTGSGTGSFPATITSNAVDGSKINITSNAAGDMMWYNGTDWERIPAGTSGNVLRSNASSIPTWVGTGSLLTAGTGITINTNTINNAAPVPQGAIIMWSGSFATIPSGWVLCDGANGTPDLRNRFILGANITGDVGLTGGTNSQTLTLAQIPSHSHTGTTDASAPALSFNGTNATISPTATFSGGATSSNGAGTINNMLWDDGASYAATGTLSLSAGSRTRSWSGTSGNAMRRLDLANHSHTVTGTVTVNGVSYTPAGSVSGSSHTHSFTTGSSGSGSAIDNRPAYFQLAFIMKQ